MKAPSSKKPILKFLYIDSTHGLDQRGSCKLLESATESFEEGFCVFNVAQNLLQGLELTEYMCLTAIFAPLCTKSCIDDSSLIRAFDVVTTLRNNGSNVPVFLCLNEKDTLTEAESKKVSDFFTAVLLIPFKKNELHEAIRLVLPGDKKQTQYQTLDDKKQTPDQTLDDNRQTQDQTFDDNKQTPYQTFDDNKQTPDQTFDDNRQTQDEILDYEVTNVDYV